VDKSFQTVNKRLHRALGVPQTFFVHQGGSPEVFVGQKGKEKRKGLRNTGLGSSL